MSSRIAQSGGSSAGLDDVAALQSFHDGGVFALLVAPVVLALAGVAPLRAACTFVAFALAGAALTAPFVVARVAGP